MNRYRQILNSMPERSGEESRTADYLISHFKNRECDHLYTNLGGYGVLACFKGENKGPSIMFRAEMDAVDVDGIVAHLCGHDGHMAILLELSDILNVNREFYGEVWLLFQPAEENGSGAKLMAKEIDELGIKFDYSFAIHNSPGYSSDNIIIFPKVYAAASVGVEFYFKGRSSHAAFPEEAISPCRAIFEIINRLDEINSINYDVDNFILSTVVGVEIGDSNYGVTPGWGYLRVTLRANSDDNLDSFIERLIRISKSTINNKDISMEIKYYDRFPATINSLEANSILKSSIDHLGLNAVIAKEPSRGSDDFAFFAFNSNASFFDIGNGLFSKGLHHINYNFDDSVIESALKIYKNIIYKTT